MSAPGDGAERRGEAEERLYNAIEAVLARMRRHEDTSARMAELRSRYPSPSFFLESSGYMLKCAGLGRLEAFYFSMIPGLTRRALSEAMGTRPTLNTVSAMAAFLKTLYIGVHIECFYLILLDGRGRLIDAVLAQKGTNDSAPFYMKQVLAVAVQREAKAIVLCHNHPGGTLKPSREDMVCTLRTLNAVTPLGIPMLDHIIIAGRRAVSIRELGLIPAGLWTLQAPKSRLVRDWLDKDLLV